MELCCTFIIINKIAFYYIYIENLNYKVNKSVCSMDTKAAIKPTFLLLLE